MQLPGRKPRVSLLQTLGNYATRGGWSGRAITALPSISSASISTAILALRGDIHFIINCRYPRSTWLCRVAILKRGLSEAGCVLNAVRVVCLCDPWGARYTCSAKGKCLDKIASREGRSQREFRQCQQAFALAHSAARNASTASTWTFE